MTVFKSSYVWDFKWAFKLFYFVFVLASMKGVLSQPPPPLPTGSLEQYNRQRSLSNKLSLILMMCTVINITLLIS
jgi:hypothetical protein